MRTFETPEEMLSVLTDGLQDLYNKETGEYVFLYNDCNSIAVYYLSDEEVKKLRKEAGDESWSGYLGPGGRIYDDPSYEDYDENQTSNLEWCEEHYNGVWEEV